MTQALSSVKRSFASKLVVIMGKEVEKRLRDDSAFWEILMVRFLAREPHPNILQYRFAVGDGGVSLYSPRMRCDLSQLADMSDLQVKRMTFDIGSALIFIHAAGIWHKDVKPHNILVDGERYVLCDFGSSSFKSDPTPNGTYSIRAPELWADGVFTDACDVWSLGATIFYCQHDHRYPYSHRSSNRYTDIVKQINASVRGGVGNSFLHVDPEARGKLDLIRSLDARALQLPLWRMEWDSYEAYEARIEAEEWKPAAQMVFSDISFVEILAMYKKTNDLPLPGALK